MWHQELLGGSIIGYEEEELQGVQRHIYEHDQGSWEAKKACDWEENWVKET